MKTFLFTFFFLFLLVPASLYASSPDLEINSSDIRFSTDEFIAGETVRIYIKVRNTGDEDISGYITFYNGSEIIDSSQVVTLVAGGAYEDAWVDFIIPYQDHFNIRALVKGTEPEDINSANDEILTPLYTIIIDDDRDGIDDDQDNCPEQSNESQQDTDGDGLGDACDSDDDNDGLSDDIELEIGTDAKDADTDGDSFNDLIDEFPTDPEVYEIIAYEVEQDSDEVSEDENEDESLMSLYEQDNTNDQQEEQVDNKQTLIERSSGAVLYVSPNASFVFMREGWKEYVFETRSHASTYDSLQWDFGDGSSSVQPQASHVFEQPGVYEVTLTLIDEQGDIHTDIQEITISFFHLSNPLVQIIIVLLIVLLFLNGLLYIRKPECAQKETGKNQKKSKKSKKSSQSKVKNKKGTRKRQTLKKKR